jgi:hypothetical protein
LQAVTRRLAALSIALAFGLSSASPCPDSARAAATAGGDQAVHAPDPAHAADAAERHCAHEPDSVSPRCACGCTGDGASVGASPGGIAWALPGPDLAEIDLAAAAGPRVPRPGAGRSFSFPIDHVPIGA